jgi:hypothetical protein
MALETPPIESYLVIPSLTIVLSGSFAIQLNGGKYLRCYNGLVYVSFTVFGCPQY